MHQLPDLRQLPTTVQERIWTLCDLQSQATLAHVSSCFRPFWHKQTTSATKKGAAKHSTARDDWHVHQMTQTARKLLRCCMRAQMTKHQIQRAPKVHGDETVHCSLIGHFTQRHSAYVLQLTMQSVALLGHQMAAVLFGDEEAAGRPAFDIQWPDCDWELGQDEILSQSMFLSFALSCRRRAELTDDEIEHLEGMFSTLPCFFTKYAHEYQEVNAACEPMWSCTTTSAPAILMNWKTDMVEHVADKQKFMA